MYLTKDEERMLAGEYGEAIRIAMKILTKIGDIYNAESMVKIDNAHTNMTTYLDYNKIYNINDLNANNRVLTSVYIKNLK